MNGRELVLRTAGPDATRDVAAAVAGTIRSGDVVALAGELGAGKTCFVQGAARALGVEGRVVSPTFMLMRTYAGTDLTLVHVDVYRLDHLDEVRDLGEDVFAPDAVTFLEWGDAVEPLLPEDHLQVVVLLGDGEADRTLRLRGHGTWVPRVAELTIRLEPWLAEEAG